MCPRAIRRLGPISQPGNSPRGDLFHRFRRSPASSLFQCAVFLPNARGRSGHRDRGHSLRRPRSQVRQLLESPGGAQRRGPQRDLPRTFRHRAGAGSLWSRIQPPAPARWPTGPRPDCRPDPQGCLRPSEGCPTGTKGDHPRQSRGSHHSTHQDRSDVGRGGSGGGGR